MIAGEATQRLEAARSHVERVCTWLACPAPEVLDRCTGVLAAAASELTGDAEWLRLARDDADALEEAWKLHRAVRRAGRLLDHASQYHIQWTRMLGSRVDGYQPGGEPAPLVHPPQINLRG
jgi:hypothetical protein